MTVVDLNPGQFGIVQKATPLQYRYDEPGRSRLELLHPSAPPPKPNEYTFSETTSRMTGRGGTRTVTTPGTDPHALSYVDYHHRGDNHARIDYMATRSDARGQGHARTVVDALYRKHQGGTVDWGEIMHPHAQALMDEMAAKHPNVRTVGQRLRG